MARFGAAWFGKEQPNEGGQVSHEFENVLAHLRVVRRRGDRAEALCPNHQDHRPSLSIAKGTDQPVILLCRAGCPTDAVLKSIGLTMADLMGTGAPHVVASYAYTDASGTPLYYVDRFVPKSFRPRLLDGTYARPVSADEVLYNAAGIAKAIANEDVIYLVEGERDCEVARDFGYTATTAMSGAGQPWLPQFSESLAGAHVVVVADNDVTGRKRARRLHEELDPITRSCRAALPRMGKDIADHLLAGYDIDLLDPLPASDDALVVYTMRHVPSMPMTWAWLGWIPDSMLTLIEGDPGDGKSVLTLDLAARWTTGMPMPDGSINPFGGPVNVGIVSAEDDPMRIIRPRFILAGGNPDRLAYIAGMPMGSRYLRSVDLELDVDAIREAIEAHSLRLLFFDPLMAFMGSTRTAVDSEVRKVLTPLRYLAEETHCAIVAVRHLRKAGGKAVHAGGGSIAFTGQARSVLLVGRNPHDEEQRILAITKSNVAKPPVSLAYRLANDPITSTPHVQWEGESELRAVDLLDTGLVFSSEIRGEVAAEVVRLLTIEDLGYDLIRKRVLANGVECGEKMLRSVLKSVAIQLREGQGTQAYKVTYRLRSNFGPNVPPESEWQDEEPVPSTSEDKVNGKSKSLVSPDEAESTHSNDSSESVVGKNPGETKDYDLPSTSEDKPDGTPLPSSAIHSDEVVACSICATTEEILYWDAVAAWRCRHHNPLTYRGDAA